MTKKEMKGSRLLGSAQILGATIIWGYGYIVIRNSLDFIAFHNLMTWRYVIAVFLLALVFGKHLRELKRDALPKGAVLGALLYVGQYFQTAALGYADTSAGRVAFITALYVVFVPFLNWALFREKPGRLCILAVCLALPGLALLTGAGPGGIGTGDLLALLGSAGFTVHILAVDRFTRDEDPVLLTILQFGFAAVFAAFLQAAAGVSFGIGGWEPGVLWPLFYLGAVSTMLGFLLQLLGQKHLPPELSAVLLAAESVFGMLFSAVLLGERLTFQGLLGCALMLGAILLSEKGR